MTDKKYRIVEYDRADHYSSFFHRQLEVDPDMSILFDPMVFKGTDDDLKYFTGYSGKYFAVYDTESGVPFGVAGFVGYHRLSLGWKVFLSVTNTKEDMYIKVLKSLINYYFNNFTEKYLYMEVFIPPLAELENLNGKELGEGIIFVRGQERMTSQLVFVRPGCKGIWNE